MQGKCQIVFRKTGLLIMTSTNIRLKKTKYRSLIMLMASLGEHTMRDYGRTLY